MVIVVEIEDRCFAKPFLGGWRNVVTGTEYHDARTQTCPRDNVVYSRGKKKRMREKERRREEKEEKREMEADRDDSSFSQGSNVIANIGDVRVGTKTTSVLMAPRRSEYTSVVCERAIQTSRLPDLRDKLVTPRPAEAQTFTKDDNGASESALTLSDNRSRLPDASWTNLSRLQEDAAIKIQKCYRAYRARMDIKALALLSRETRAPTPPKPEKIHRLRGCRASEFEIMNAVEPRNRTDFEMVASVLERWRFYENARLERDFFGASKLAARTNALRREIEILRSIERIRARVRGERKERKRREYLDRIAEPEVWRVSNGKILVDTPRVRRARECRDFYRLLTDERITGNARIEILKIFRKYVSGHTCDHGRYLVCLVDQEIELYPISRDEQTTGSLRNRLTAALLRLIVNFCAPDESYRRAPDNNSRISRHSTRKQDTFSRICRRCGRFLTIDDLSARIVSPSYQLLTTCENCRKIQPGKQAKIVYEPYEIMLRDLRIREKNLGSADKSPAWIVDSRIIYRLVNYVWHGKSGISECDDLYRLILVRFRPDDVWSPWNNLVLTKREAALHQSMQDPRQIYARMIIKKFVIKNLQAKLRFDFKNPSNFL